MRPVWASLAGVMLLSAHAAMGEEATPVRRPERIVSAGLCADQMVVPMLDSSRIAGVSTDAADPILSPVAEEARLLPVVSPSAEELILAGADTVVMDAYGNGKTKTMLEKLGVRVIRVPYDDGLDTIPETLRTFGRDLDASAGAERIVADFSSRMQRVISKQPTVPVSGVYLRADGGSAGLGTYVNDVMTVSGYKNLAATLGQKGWGRFDLETLVLNPPDALIAAFFSADSTLSRQAAGRHPVLRRLSETVPVVQTPGFMWGCGGWPVVLAAEHITASRPVRGMP